MLHCVYYLLQSFAVARFLIVQTNKSNKTLTTLKKFGGIGSCSKSGSNLNNDPQTEKESFIFLSEIKCQLQMKFFFIALGSNLCYKQRKSVIRWSTWNFRSKINKKKHKHFAYVQIDFTRFPYWLWHCFRTQSFQQVCNQYLNASYVQRRFLNWNTNALVNVLLLLPLAAEARSNRFWYIAMAVGLFWKLGLKANASDELLRAKSDILFETDNRHNDNEQKIKRLNRTFWILCTSFGLLKAFDRFELFVAIESIELTARLAFSFTLFRSQLCEKGLKVRLSLYQIFYSIASL